MEPANGQAPPGAVATLTLTLTPASSLMGLPITTSVAIDSARGRKAGSVSKRVKDLEAAAIKQEVGMGLARAELQHEYTALQRSRAALGAETNEFAQDASIEAEQRANSIFHEREAQAASALEGRLVDAERKAEHHVQTKIREFEERAQQELRLRVNSEFNSKLRCAEDRVYSASAEHHAAAEKQCTITVLLPRRRPRLVNRF